MGGQGGAAELWPPLRQQWEADRHVLFACKGPGHRPGLDRRRGEEVNGCRRMNCAENTRCIVLSDASFHAEFVVYNSDSYFKRDQVADAAARYIEPSFCIVFI